MEYSFRGGGKALKAKGGETMGKERKQGTGVFSEKLRELMKKNSLTQQELADSIGIARQTVGKYLDGLCYPQANILSKISVKYGVSIFTAPFLVSCFIACPPYKLILF